MNLPLLVFIVVLVCIVIAFVYEYTNIFKNVDHFYSLTSQAVQNTFREFNEIEHITANDRYVYAVSKNSDEKKQIIRRIKVDAKETDEWDIVVTKDKSNLFTNNPSEEINEIRANNNWIVVKLGNSKIFKTRTDEFSWKKIVDVGLASETISYIRLNDTRLYYVKDSNKLFYKNLEYSSDSGEETDTTISDVELFDVNNNYIVVKSTNNKIIRYSIDVTDVKELSTNTSSNTLNDITLLLLNDSHIFTHPHPNNSINGHSISSDYIDDTEDRMMTEGVLNNYLHEDIVDIKVKQGCSAYSMTSDYLFFLNGQTIERKDIGYGEPSFTFTLQNSELPHILVKTIADSEITTVQTYLEDKIKAIFGNTLSIDISTVKVQFKDNSNIRYNVTGTNNLWSTEFPHGLNSGDTLTFKTLNDATKYGINRPYIVQKVSDTDFQLKATTKGTVIDSDGEHDPATAKFKTNLLKVLVKLDDKYVLSQLKPKIASLVTKINSLKFNYTSSEPAFGGLTTPVRQAMNIIIQNFDDSIPMFAYISQTLEEPRPTPQVESGNTDGEDGDEDDSDGQTPAYTEDDKKKFREVDELSLSKKACVRKKKNCNVGYTPYSTYELDQLNPKTNEYYSKKEKKSIKKRFSNLCVPKKDVVEKSCCDPLDNRYDSFKKVSPMLRNTFKNGIVVKKCNNSINSIKRCKEDKSNCSDITDQIVQPSLYDFCKLQKVKDTDIDETTGEIKTNKLMKDCYQGRCDNLSNLSELHPENENEKITNHYYLIDAVKGNNVDYLKSYFSNRTGNNVNEELKYGYPGNRVLHQAVYDNVEDVFEFLLTLNPDLSLVNRDGNSALQIACLKGNYNHAHKMIKLGASPQCKNNMGDTSLHSAVRSGSYNTVLVLLDNGANMILNEINEHGETPLHTAVVGKKLNFKIVELLVKYGAEVSLKTNYYGETILTTLLKHEKTVARESIRTFIQRGYYNKYNNEDYSKMLENFPEIRPFDIDTEIPNELKKDYDEYASRINYDNLVSYDDEFVDNRGLYVEKESNAIKAQINSNHFNDDKTEDTKETFVGSNNNTIDDSMLQVNTYSTTQLHKNNENMNRSFEKKINNKVIGHIDQKIMIISFVALVALTIAILYIYINTLKST